MTDPISTAAGAATIIDRLAAAGLWLQRRFQRGNDPLFPNYSEPSEFELKPVHVRIDLLPLIPYVELRFYAINYTTRPLILLRAGTQIERLILGHTVDTIPLLQDYRMSPRGSSLIFFRRNLLDSEARVFREGRYYAMQSASYQLVASARYKNKQYSYGPVSSRSIDGWINM